MIAQDRDLPWCFNDCVSPLFLVTEHNILTFWLAWNLMMAMTRREVPYFAGQRNLCIQKPMLKGFGIGVLVFFWMVKGTTCMLHSTFIYSIQGCFQGSFCMLVNLAWHHAIGQFVLIIEGELFTSAELFRFPKSAPKPAHGSKGLASCQEAWYSLGLGDPQTSVLTLFSDFD